MLYNLAVDAIDCANHLFPAVVQGNFLDVMGNFINLLL